MFGCINHSDTLIDVVSKRAWFGRIRLYSNIDKLDKSIGHLSSVCVYTDTLSIGPIL